LKENEQIVNSIPADSFGLLYKNHKMIREIREKVMPRTPIKSSRGQADKMIVMTLKESTKIDWALAAIQMKQLCNKCAKCCNQAEHIILNEEDMARISEATDLKPDQFSKIIQPSNDCVIKNDSPCMFLKGNRCLIYRVRPFVCETFPFNTDLGVMVCREGCNIVPEYITQKIIKILEQASKPREEMEATMRKRNSIITEGIDKLGKGASTDAVTEACFKIAQQLIRENLF